MALSKILGVKDHQSLYVAARVHLHPRMRKTQLKMQPTHSEAETGIESVSYLLHSWILPGLKSARLLNFPVTEVNTLHFSHKHF